MPSDASNPSSRSSKGSLPKESSIVAPSASATGSVTGVTGAGSATTHSFFARLPGGLLIGEPRGVFIGEPRGVFIGEPRRLLLRGDGGGRVFLGQYFSFRKTVRSGVKMKTAKPRNSH